MNTDVPNPRDKVESDWAHERLKRVITVCEAKDITTWKIASPAILHRIAAEDYLLICPDSQIESFRNVTPEKWRIVAESQFSSNGDIPEIRARVRGENIHRVHWLFQQFLKINAIVESDLRDEDSVLIWDADTVPLKHIDFIDTTTGKLIYYHGTENHLPYFDTVESLLGLGKLFEGSFIAQNLPLRAGWAREVTEKIEALSGAPYTHAILVSLPGYSGSEFSEYETIGTWAYRHHRDEMIIRSRNRWLRSGTALLGKNLSSRRAQLVLKLLSLHFDYVAIENWSRDLGPRALIHLLGRKIKLLIGRT